MLNLLEPDILPLIDLPVEVAVKVTVPLLCVKVPPEYCQLPVTFKLPDGAVTVPAETVKSPPISASLLNVHPPPLPLKSTLLNFLPAPVKVPDIVFPVEVALNITVPVLGLKVPLLV